jgi:hypothetical protein
MFSTMVSKLPDCDFCGDVAAFDGKTVEGPWANMCAYCFQMHGRGVGMGIGQLLCVRPLDATGENVEFAGEVL